MIRFANICSPKAFIYYTLAFTTHLSSFMVINAHADNTTIPVDMSSVHSIQHEIALLNVLADMCPSMLTDLQKQHFYAAYNNKLKELLPTLDEPRMALQYLSTQRDYLQLLNEIRLWTLGFSNEENQIVCVDMADNSF